MTLRRDYFDAVYAEGADPFKLSSNWYEERKYAITVASLPRARYRRGIEPGCSIGVLTEKLRTRCDFLVSTDIVDAALRSARARVETSAVRFLNWSFTDDWDDVTGEKPFDLIVLSEVGYYLDAEDLRSAVDTAVSHLEPGGTFLAVHWRHPVADYPLTGDQVHAILGATTGLDRLGGYVDEDFVLEVYTATEGTAPSIGRSEGLV